MKYIIYIAIASILFGCIQSEPGEHKHKFQPRYSKEWSTDLADIMDVESARGIEFTGRSDRYLKKQIYVYDICVKCGKTIKE